MVYIDLMREKLPIDLKIFFWFEWKEGIFMVKNIWEVKQASYPPMGGFPKVIYSSWQKPKKSSGSESFSAIFRDIPFLNKPRSMLTFLQDGAPQL